jgi:hypothetical protein
MNHKLLIISLLAIFSLKTFAQETLKIVLPNSENWNVLHEGKLVNFELKAVGGNAKNYHFSISQGKIEGMKIDAAGLFSWNPAYDLVDRISQNKNFQVIFEVNDSVNVASQKVDFRVFHTNRPPILGDLKPFYVKYNTTNIYQIDNSSVVRDEDNDPIVFIPIVEQMPEGMKMTSQGEFTWSPSYTQFRNLKEKPTFIEFFVEDQPAKSQVKGKLKIEATQLDLPPEITLVPKENFIREKENTPINLRFYLADPNGDDDIQTFDFLSDNQEIPKNALVKNTNNQYEFIWKPTYDFVKDPYDSVAFHIDFYVLDKTQKRAETRINFIVKNTINEVERDQKNYALYRGTVLSGWELIEQLKDKEILLKKQYNKAKKGKKQRSMITAGLGATTGLSPVLAKTDLDLRTAISTIGGTSTLTIGTLEATEVIGRSMKDLIERLNYVIEKKNDIQTKGDVFARDFSLKSSRRQPDFIKRIDDLMAIMSLKGLVILELDANWEPKNKPNDTNIKKTFKDFSDESELGQHN